MDWSNERYVRVYVRDSRNLKLFGWEGRALLWEVIRKADRAGVIEGVHNADDLALMVDMPVEVVRAALARIQSVDPDTIVLRDLGAVLPRYIDAQESKQSDKQRQRESRAKRSERARVVTTGDIESLPVTESAESVTDGHTESQSVTVGHSVPCRAVPCHAVPNTDSSASQAQASPPAKQKQKPVECPEDFQPDDRQVEALAKKHGVDEARIRSRVPEFIWFWLEGKGQGTRRSLQGWRRTFANRIDAEAKSEVLFAEPRNRSSDRNSSKAAIDAQIRSEREWRKKHPQRRTDALAVGDDPWGLAGEKPQQRGNGTVTSGQSGRDVEALLPGIAKPVDNPLAKPTSTHTGRRMTAEQIDAELAKETNNGNQS